MLHAQTAPALSTDSPLMIYTAGPGITAPELLPHAAAQSYVNDHCKDHKQGKITFSLIVDANGEPRNVYFLSAFGDMVDVLMLKHVTEDRFKPGTLNGQPVAIAESLDVFVRSCLHSQKDKNGQEELVLYFSAEPQQTLRPPVDPPLQTVLVSGTGLSKNPSDPDPPAALKGGSFTNPTRLVTSGFVPKIDPRIFGPGDYAVSVVVDRYGMPHRMKVLRSSHSGLEKQLAGIVYFYRFKPAMKNGEPVPATTVIELSDR